MYSTTIIRRLVECCILHIFECCVYLVYYDVVGLLVVTPISIPAARGRVVKLDVSNMMGKRASVCDVLAGHHLQNHGYDCNAVADCQK